jgi:hypothetical protein
MFNIYFSQCLSKCNDRYYSYDDKNCLKCEETCNNCTGPSADECTSCL